MPPRVDRTGSVTAGTATTSSYVDFLKVTNPKIEELLARNPGLKVFLDRADAVGAVARPPAAGQVATDHQWSVWSHSPKSADLPKNWRDEVIVVFQTDGDKKHTIDFGPEKYQGSIIGVFSKGQVFTDEVVTKDPHTGVEGGFSDDDGFEALMKVRTVGAAGSKAGIAFATGMLDGAGKAAGYWGWPGEYDYAHNCFGGGGYDGRQYEFNHGTADNFPIDDHGKKVVLKPVNHAPGKAPFAYEDYKAPRAGGVTADGVDRTGGRTNVLNTIGGSVHNTVSPGTGGGTSPLWTRIINN